MTTSCRCLAGGLLGWLLLLNSFVAQAQARLNLGLEPGINHGHPLMLWGRHRAPGAQVQFDSLVHRQGRGSLRLTLEEEEARVYAAVFTYSFPLDSVRGQLVSVSVWVRTRGFRGRAGGYAFANTGTSEGTATDRVHTLDSLPRDADWRRLELRLPVKAGASSFGIGLQAEGSGQIWFDNVQVRVAGRLLRETPQAGTEALLLTPLEALTPNWDFERPLPRLARPDPARATVALDSAQPPHGRHYLRVARVEAGTGAAAVYLGTLPLGAALFGKSLQVSGFWRQAQPGGSAGEAPGFSYALLSTDEGSSYHNDSPTGWGESELRLLPPLPAPGLQWAAFTFTLPVPNDYARLAAAALYLRLPGGGVELDNLRFSLNGTPYEPQGPPTPPAPTAAEIAWLRAALKPLSQPAPAADFQDVATLGAFIGPARLVGLGDVTTSSHEIFALKSRLVRYLVSQKGFKVLALPLSPADGQALNAYLQTGQGDPARLLAALEPWDTAEMLDLLRWLRGYCQAHPATVSLAGFSLPPPEQALAQFAQTVAANDEFVQPRLQQLRQLLATIRQPSEAAVDLRRQPGQGPDSLLAPLRRLLGELAAGLDTRAKLLRGGLGGRELARQRYYLRLAEQGAVLRRLPPDFTSAYRAACQAENVQWLIQPDATTGTAPKLLIWAHNKEIAKSAGPDAAPLGQWLRAAYGPGYLALGLALGEGSYAAENSRNLLVATALQPATPGTYEAWLRTGPPAFWLGLRQLDLTEANAWLLQQQLLRDVGRRATQHQFGVHTLSGEFDAVLFLRTSTPAHPLP